MGAGAVSTPQAYGGAILMALTSTPMPKLMVTPGGPRDWTFLFPAEGDTLKASQGGFADFQSKHNKARPHEAVFTVNATSRPQCRDPVRAAYISRGRVFNVF